MEENIEVAKQGIGLLQIAYSAVNTVSQLYYGYDKTALSEIGQIQTAYEKHCLPNEKDCLALSTLKESTETFPSFFRMNKEKKVPVVFEQGFCPEKTLQHWVPLLSQNLVSNFVEDMLGYMCEYQTQRDERYPGQKGYDYDPTNLFLEEFKHWLVALSKAQVEANPQVMAVMEGRIKYLSYFIDHRVFISGEQLPTREMIVIYLRDMLVNHIRPTVELAQLRQSAREHFKQLKLNTQCLIKQSTEFLCYVFRDSVDTPVNFIMAQIKRPTLPNYVAVLADRSGSLLHYLVNTPAVNLVYPELARFSGEKKPFSPQLTNLTTEPLTTSHFLDAENQLIYPLNRENTNIDNWYKESKEQPSGILPFFQTDTCMLPFVKLHHQIEELAIFYLICSVIFELAGEGGNLLVYKYAMKEVKTIIENYQYFIEGFKETLNTIWTASETLQRLIVEKKVKETEEMKRWRAHKALSASAYQAMHKFIKDNHTLVEKIETKILETNTEDYLAWVKKQTEFLSELASAFCQYSITATQHEFAELEEKPHLSLTFWSKEENEEDVLEKVVEYYNIAHAAYEDNNYAITEKMVFQLFNDYPEDSLPFRNDLLVLRYQSYLKQNRLDDALKDMDELLRTEPDNLQCRLNKAYLLYHHTHGYLDASHEVAEVLKADKTHAEALTLKAQIEQHLTLVEVQTIPKPPSFQL